MRRTAYGAGLCLACGFALHGCASNFNVGVGKAATTTYEKHLARAIAGNAESQNLLGFMHYFGDGVERDNNAALTWLARAAEQGHPVAIASLGRLAEEMGKEPEQANTDKPAKDAPRRTLEPGEETYASFCAGCHGLNGIAAHVDAPSFALGDRLDGIDLILRRSIVEGVGAMPGWGDMFSSEELDNLVNFIHTLPDQYRRGIDQKLRDQPVRYFLFNAMRNNDRAFKRDQNAPASVPYLRKSTNSLGDN